MSRLSAEELAKLTPSSLDPNSDLQLPGGDPEGSAFDRITFKGSTEKLTVEFFDVPISVGGSGRVHKYRKRDAIGASGGVASYQGTEPTELTLELTLWRIDHFLAWEKLRDLIAPAEAKKEPALLKVEHVRLRYLNLDTREFFVDQVGPPADAGPQQMRVSLQLTQAMPAAKAAEKQAGSGAKAEGQRRVYYNEIGRLHTNASLNPPKQRTLSQQLRQMEGDTPNLGPLRPSVTSSKP